MKNSKQKVILAILSIIVIVTVVVSFQSSYIKKIRAKITINYYQKTKDKYNPREVAEKLFGLGTEIIPVLVESILLPDNRGVDTSVAEALFKLEAPQYPKVIVKLLSSEKEQIRSGILFFMQDKLIETRTFNINNANIKNMINKEVINKLDYMHHNEQVRYIRKLALDVFRKASSNGSVGVQRVSGAKKD